MNSKGSQDEKFCTGMRRCLCKAVDRCWMYTQACVKLHFILKDAVKKDTAS